MAEAKNFTAIKNWIAKNRPDCSPHMDQLMRQDAFILVMTMSFEAGREFQRDLPDPTVYNGAGDYC